VITECLNKLTEQWVPKEAYVDPGFASEEKQKLWPRVWQMACREEELPNIGSFVTYDILDESVIVIRTSATEIKALNNACLHRGRQLTEGCGQTSRLVCKFHGWKWNINGSVHEVVERDDWGKTLTDEDLRLTEFKVGTWGGFVFINFDPNCEPLERFLEPVQIYLDPMEFDKQRYRWHITIEMDANWKLCQEAFQEAYHVSATHPQVQPYLDQRSITLKQGKHSQIRSLPAHEQVVGRFSHSNIARQDGRLEAYEVIRQQAHDIRSVFSDRDCQAAARVLKEMPEGTSYHDAFLAIAGYMREAALATGAGYPELTATQAYEAGFDWTVFPNLITVFSPAASLWYRTRPMPDNNPDRCLLEIFGLERFAPGAEPKFEKLYFKHWRDYPDMPRFLIQDWRNIPQVHRGAKTCGFKGARVNPKQERTISGFYESLRDYLLSPDKPGLRDVNATRDSAA
jgi:phenylpropionate dioxygenase-like ring-hydroxylating dioxygenase large terminal subunit